MALRRSKDRASGLVAAGSGQALAVSDGDVLDDGEDNGSPVVQETSRLSPEQQAKILGLPYTDLTDFSFDPKAVRILSETDARNYLVVPLLVRGGRATLAAAEPGRMNLVDELTELIGMPVDLVVSPVALLVP